MPSAPTMMTTASQMAPVVVIPRLVLPSTEGQRADDVDSATFRRQLTVALGRSHSQRTPRRDVIFRVQQGTRLEKQRLPAMRYHDESRCIERKSATAQKPCTTDRSRWTTTAESVAPAFSPPSVITPRTTWYEQADKIFCFFGYVVDKAPASTRLVTIHFYPQDSTLEMVESKETSTPGLGRMFASRRPARVSLENIKVGSDVLINGTRVHIYDADEFTRRSIAELLPPERAPCPDTTFSVTPRLAPPQRSSCHHNQNSRGSANANYTRDISEGATPRSWMVSMRENFANTWPGDTSAPGEDPPMFLRIFIRWDDSTGEQGNKRRFILNYFLEDGTIEMREINDVRNGYHFQGKFPRVIRRQRVLKDGKEQSLGVDHIGRNGSVPRSSRPKGGGRGIFGSGGPDDLGVGEYLSPQDMLVGRTVVLMKRPMTVCGWDEASLAWWQNTAGMNMRGMQRELDDFRQCVRPQRSRPRPPNKLKSTFFEDPPQRPGTVRGRFLKASKNNGKTLRFLAKTTRDTETPSTKGNDFIIKFYPEDDTLSIFSSHNLGGNSGGAYKGVYLSRTGNAVNKINGEPLKAEDFCIGFVARLPSLSLEVVDVDDFSRHYLTQKAHPFPDPRWQTAPVWRKLLRVATAAPSPPALGVYGGRNDNIISTQARPPSKTVNFTIGSSYDGSDRDTSGGGVMDAQPPSNSPDDEDLPEYSSSPVPKDDARTEAGAMETFVSLWAECIGYDDTYSWFHAGRPRSDGECCSDDRTRRSRVESKTATGTGGNKFNSATADSTIISPGTSSPRPHDRSGSHSHFQSSPPGCLSTPPWERLLGALSRRGIYVHKELTAHERMLLERELVDWWRDRGSGAGPGHEQNQSIEEDLASPIVVPRSSRSPMDASDPTTMTLVATENARNDGNLAFSSACKKPKPSIGEAVALVTGQAHSPSGVGLSENSVQDPSMMVSGAKGDDGKEQDRLLAEESPEAKPGTGGGPLTKTAMSQRPLDMRAVALGVYEAPSTGRDDQVVREALQKVWAGVFGRGGEVVVRRTLEAESKYLRDPADLLTMTRLLQVTAGLSRHETNALWLKFMPTVCAKVGDGGRVTIADFLDSIKMFETCLRRGEMLGLSNVGRNHTDRAASMAEDCGNVGRERKRGGEGRKSLSLLGL